MNLTRLGLFILLAAPTLSARGAVVLEPAQRENLGIQSVAAQVLEVTRPWPAAAVVLDGATLAASLSDLQSAEAATEVSGDEYRRTEKLYLDDGNVARKTRDAARAQFIADQGRVATVRSQIASAWGPGILALNAAARRRLAAEVMAGRVALVRAEPLQPLPANARVNHADLGEFSGAAHWRASMLGALPQGTAAAFAGAYLLSVAAPLPAGRILQANLADARPATRGRVISATAVVRWHGAEWVYVEESANHFQRCPLGSGMRVDDRVLLDEKLPQGASIVVAGARALLGAELAASEPDAGE